MEGVRHKFPSGYAMCYLCPLSFFDMLDTHFKEKTRRSFMRASAGAMAAFSSESLLAQTRGKQKGKKGLSIKAKNDKAKKVISDLHADWFYAWGGKRPGGVDEKIKFTPMIFTYWGEDQKIAKIGRLTKEAGGKNLLGYNEPDRENQGNVTMKRAIKGWKALQETGLRLGSPACVHPDGEWMKEFMAQAKKEKLKVDFVCLHSYGGTSSKAFLQRLEKVRKMYGKPIWITEFACGDWNAKSPEQNKHHPDKVLKFMETVFPALDRLDYIERYAWFPAGQKSNALGTSALYDSNFKLTKLGKFFRDHKS